MLLLFLGLVGLGMIVVESLRAPPPEPAEVAAATAAEDDVLELRLGAPPAPEAAAPLVAPAVQPNPAGAAGGGGPGATASGTPSAAAPATPAKPAVPSTSLYVVQPGDTLSTIAQKQLGSATLAAELARLNGITDPNRIRAGMQIRLR